MSPGVEHHSLVADEDLCLVSASELLHHHCSIVVPQISFLLCAQQHFRLFTLFLICQFLIVLCQLGLSVLFNLFLCCCCFHLLLPFFSYMLSKHVFDLIELILFPLQYGGLQNSVLVVLVIPILFECSECPLSHLYVAVHGILPHDFVAPIPLRNFPASKVLFLVLQPVLQLFLQLFVPEEVCCILSLPRVKLLLSCLLCVFVPLLQGLLGVDLLELAEQVHEVPLALLVPLSESIHTVKHSPQRYKVVFISHLQHTT